MQNMYIIIISLIYIGNAKQESEESICSSEDCTLVNTCNYMDSFIGMGHAINTVSS